MQVEIIDLEGKKIGTVKLPVQFQEEERPDLIKRAFLSEASFKFQPKGSFWLAGLQTTAAYYGRRHAWRQTINTGRSRLPREKIPGGRSGQVKRVPHAVKGRRAHPPKPEKIIIERINVKEKNKAIRSALTIAFNDNAVKVRGHENAKSIVIDSGFEKLKKVKDAIKTLEKLGYTNDLTRAREGRKKRSGRAKLRKGGYTTPKSVLVIYGKDDGVWKACRNIPGVDVEKVNNLTLDKLAPGGVAGRPCIITANAIEVLTKEKLFE